MDEKKKTRYTMVSKTGQEIYSSDSFLGFIVSTIITCLGAAFVLMAIGAIISGIAYIFK